MMYSNVTTALGRIHLHLSFPSFDVASLVFPIAAGREKHTSYSVT
jgi:hypothetical protein